MHYFRRFSSGNSASKEFLDTLKSQCDEADRALAEAEERSRQAWAAYWTARGDFREGDVVQHPSLRGRGEWVVSEIAYLARGDLYLTVKLVENGTVISWRRITPDGLLRVVRSARI